VLKTLIDTAISTAPIADVLRDLLPDEVYYRFSPEGTSFGVAIDQVRNPTKHIHRGLDAVFKHTWLLIFVD
jgi:hypothetical protein